MSEWQPRDFLIGDIHTTVRRVVGYARGGLGLDMRFNASPKGRRPPAWALSHLATGHRIVMIEAHQAEAMEIADQFVALTDWDFIGLDGWRNRDPELAQKVRDLTKRHHPKTYMVGRPSNQEAAQVCAAQQAQKEPMARKSTIENWRIRGAAAREFGEPLNLNSGKTPLQRSAWEEGWRAKDDRIRAEKSAPATVN